MQMIKKIQLALVVHKFTARKNVETVSEKKKNAKRILEMIDEAVGEDNVTMYLDFVNKLNNKSLKLQNRNGNENERAISRLLNNKGKILRKRGRKINKNFESEIWANLMICSYEENDNEV
jgi:hypothetical protein